MGFTWYNCTWYFMILISHLPFTWSDCPFEMNGRSRLKYHKNITDYGITWESSPKYLTIIKNLQKKCLIMAYGITLGMPASWEIVNNIFRQAYIFQINIWRKIQTPSDLQLFQHKLFVVKSRYLSFEVLNICFFFVLIKSNHGELML